MAATGGVITTGAHPKALWPGIKSWWGRSYDQHEQEYPDFYDIENSDKAYEQDVEITGFSMLREKGQGAPITFDTEMQGAVTTYAHVAYAGGYIVTFEELRDNLYEVVSKRRAAMLAFAGRQTEEVVAANPYNQAFNTNFVGGDGTSLISTQHYTPSGYQSNQLTTSADLSETAIEDLGIQIMQATDARGNKIALIPESLLIPSNYFYDAQRILQSALQNDTANNAVNVIKGMFRKGVKVNHYFTSSTNWFIRTNCPLGMRFFWRDKPIFDTDNEFNTKNAQAAQYMRFSCGWTDFRQMFGAAGV